MLVAVVVHPTRPQAAETAEMVSRICAEHGAASQALDVWQDEQSPADVLAGMAQRPQLVVTIGGDGTLLRGLAVAVEADAPVLGVKAGRVGFLTPFAATDLPRVLGAALAGRAPTQERMLLTLRASRPLHVPSELRTLLRYGRGPDPVPPVPRPGTPDQVGWGVPLGLSALNDVVFEKLGRDRQTSVAVYLSGRLFATYSADGVMVASPTGSTAYSFAAGGPVLSPRLNALVFTPVAPHMAFNRSMVTAPDEPVGVQVLPRSGQVAVVVDGRVHGILDPGDWVAVYPARRRAKLIVADVDDFFGRLRDQFSLADAPAARADTGSEPPLLVYRPDLPVPEELQHLHLPMEESGPA
ncbi:NAD(+)/NADH kinase [Micromonospora vulcania]|uniref:NAD kinase n=1 Tax=Micromonospora vulcania TaxID=1441873 RepID=A0ABW1HE49_9ACTN